MNNDLISRDTLNEMVNDLCFCFGRETEVEGGVLIDRVAALPAVDAEPVRHEGNTTFITTNNLDDYADRIIVGRGTLCKVYYADCDEEAEPVRHGHWILRNVKFMPYGIAQECSCCREWGCISTFKENYCPNCGAKMDGEQNDIQRV